MKDAPETGDLPPSLRFLRVLVTVLTATMILGVLAIVALLVIRLQTPAMPLLPEDMTLPEGVTVSAFTRGQGWYAIVTTDNRILIFDASSGEITQEVTITATE